MKVNEDLEGGRLIKKVENEQKCSIEGEGSEKNRRDNMRLDGEDKIVKRRKEIVIIGDKVEIDNEGLKMQEIYIDEQRIKEDEKERRKVGREKRRKR